MAAEDHPELPVPSSDLEHAVVRAVSRRGAHEHDAPALSVADRDVAAALAVPARFPETLAVVARDVRQPAPGGIGAHAQERGLLPLAVEDVPLSAVLAGVEAGTVLPLGLAQREHPRPDVGRGGRGGRVVRADPVEEGEGRDGGQDVQGQAFDDAHGGSGVGRK